MNILIVDDQVDVTESIRKGVNWGTMEIGEVYTANRAADAKKIFEQKQIDILLSDIEMPGEDGLELLEWVRSMNYEAECIFLTAHADFNYAKQAIRLGSFDYILQPARIEEIEKVLLKVKDNIRRKQKMKQLEKSRDFLSGQQDLMLQGIFEKMFHGDEQEALLMFQRLPQFFHRSYESGVFYVAGIQLTRWRGRKEEWDTQLVRMVLRNVLEEVFEDCDCQLLIAPAGEFDFVVMFYGELSRLTYNMILEGLIRFHEFIMKKMEFEIAVYLSGRMKDSLHDSIHLLSQMLGDNILLLPQVFEGKNWVAKEDGELTGLTIDAWTQWIDEGQGAAVRSEIERCMNHLIHQGLLTMKVLQKIHYAFTKAFFAVLEKRKMNSSQIFGPQLTYDAYMDAYKTWQGFKDALDYCLSHIEKNIEIIEGNEDRIALAKKYVTDHISQNITRSEVAAFVFLNEEYFSRLFKKETGLVFKDYVIMEKIKVAKGLLEKTNFSIGIVGSKVGYDNFSYFSKIFRKFEGQSPQEYRQMYKKK